VVIDQAGRKLLHRRVSNAESVLLDLIAEVLNPASGSRSPGRSI
jgi:hypothetical protein